VEIETLMSRTLLTLYPRSPRRYDELLDANGSMRAHWQHLFDHLDAAPPELMKQRLEFVDRRIQENGVTYNVYAEPDGADRPWSIDPLPLILPADEWRTIETAVIQRARVIDATLADLYGEQKLLKEGLLPPALVFGQSEFLRPCVGVTPPGGKFLHIYAVDLARSPDGSWWVIADRTQSPAGAGYALENRLIVSRVFPELFRDMRVQHLAYFFRALQDSLAHWAPVAAGEQPQIVLLTPGPYNETYFEHAYLARYLGFPLVEGQDLTVRGDKVYLKTLSGLKRVHVILRRQDAAYCDPLELRGDSALGVSGLMQVVRAGNVLVSNALGSGLLGSGAMMGFLPGICEHLLGEKLEMPAVATWWCGEKPALDFALKNLDKLVIKPAYPTQRMDPVFGRDLKGAAREEMISRIQAMPHAYVAQEVVSLAQMPTWSRTHERRVLARAVGLRVYAVATPQGYVVMPGGLTRVAGGPNANMISMQRGGAAKDTWVLADDGQVNTLTLLKSTLTARDMVRSGSNLSSRVVENLYWLGRYSERFDDTARLLRVAITRLIEAGGESSPELESVLDLGVRLGVIPAANVKLKNSAEPDKHSLTPDAPSPNASIESRLLSALYAADWLPSLANNIRSLLWAATQVRERLSLDHWHSLNRLQRDLQAIQARNPPLSEALVFLDRLLLVSSSLSGFAMDNMTRDDGWRFLIIGRRIERLDFLAQTLSEFLRLSSVRQTDGLEWLLELTDSIITYRSRYLRHPELLPVLDLIVFDDSNPHSVIFQAMVVRRYVDRLTRNLGDPADDTMRQLSEMLEAVDMDVFSGMEFCNCNQCGPCLNLATELEKVAKLAQTLSDRLANRYFTHVGVYNQQTWAT
jgi:uncharacterized circularly permuted ATP-grasp superfamily protein/uncharacterized alpha-E superfamily protein